MPVMERRSTGHQRLSMRAQHRVNHLAVQRALAVLSTAPMPVVTPQPSRQTTSRGAASSILATLSSWTTVYSEKVDVPICALPRQRPRQPLC